MNEYLKKITWDPSDVPKIVRSYFSNMRIVVLVICILIGGGFGAYKSLPQTVAPEINLTIIVVSSALPGASPEDVESLVVIPLEEELAGVDGIDEITATAGSGVGSVVMTFVRGVSQERALSDVESAVSKVRDLPDDATDPAVEAIDFEDAPIATWLLASGGAAQTSFDTDVQEFIDRLESDQMIDRVETTGQPTQQVMVIVTPEQMRSYDLSISDIQSAISVATSALPSGTILGQGIERGLTIDADIEDIASLRSLPISVGNQVIALGDVATIVERPAPGVAPTYLIDGDETSNAVILNTYRVSGTDISDATRKVEGILEEFLAQKGEAIEMREITNARVDLEEQFNDLMRNLAQTAVLVFITLMLFVGRRQAMLAAVSIPLIYGIAFISMTVTGVSVNFLSLFSLMLSLGLLVDVTIVVVSAMTTYMRESRFSAKKVGGLVFRDFFSTLVMTTLTTIWAFVPLLMAGGIIGEYIKPIPVVVSSVLIGSVFVGFFVIIPLMIWLFDFSMPRRVSIFLKVLGFVVGGFIASKVLAIALPVALALIAAIIILVIAGKILYYRIAKNKQPVDSKVSDSSDKVGKDVPKTFIDVSKIERAYTKALDKILRSKVLRRKTIFAVVIFFVFSISLVAAGFVKNVFFPGEANQLFYLQLEMPQGTKAEKTEEVLRGLTPQIIAIDGVDYTTLQIGYAASEDGPSRAGDHFGLLTIMTPKPSDGGRGSQEVAADLRATGLLEEQIGGTLSIAEFAGGPPAGADVTITFVGDEIEKLRSLAFSLRQKLAESPIENIRISPETAAATIEFIPDDYLLDRENISRTQIAQQLQILTQGIDLVDDYEFDGAQDKRDIVLRSSAGDADISDLGAVTIAIDDGVVPLDALGRLALKENITRIDREDYDRTVTLTAAVTPGANAAEVNAQIAEIIDGEMDLPTGYTWKSGGANEENNDSVASIISGMGLAAVLIFLTLIIHLKSYRKAAIVLLTIPLAITGVFIIFGITGIPLTFPALIGLLALFGIVVNNAIIIISQINTNQSVGMSFREAIVHGSGSRLEPILLSSLTTMIGLIPITLSDPVWQGLGGAIIAGLMFSGIIMLFFIPVVYYMMMQDENK